MAELEVRVNKRFNIMEDVSARKDALVEHAVKLVIKQGFDPNLPMIPAPQSARFRTHCYECGEAFWGLRSAMQCDACDALQEVERELNQELHKIERETRLIEARARLVKLKQRAKESAKGPPLRIST